MKNIGLIFFSIIALEEPTLSNDFPWVQNPHTPSLPPEMCDADISNVFNYITFLFYFC